jgi:Fe-S-cluster containining protein
LEGPLLQREPTTSKAQAQAVAERYFQLGLVCPFLENDSCSIYAERPFVCRQYLVTSPAALCQDPFHNSIARLPVPIAAAGATLEIAEKNLGSPQYTVPLVLAFEYTEGHRAELERTFDAPELYRSWVQALLE